MKKKIAILCPHIGALSETFILRHTQLLPGRMVVITNQDKGDYLGHWQTDCPILVLNSPKYRIIRIILRKLKIPINLDEILSKRFLKKHNVSCVMGEFLDFCTDWVPIMVRLKIPFYAHSHGYDISVNLKKNEIIAKYKMLNSCSGIINVGNFGKERLLRIGINEKIINTIPCCPKIPEKIYNRVSNKLIKVLTSGRMVGKKSPILTLESFRLALLQYPNMHLDYIGSGALLSAANDFVRAFNLQDKITFHGAQPNVVVLQFMKRADIFISHNIIDSVTGDEEGLPVTILEAMGAGLPILSTYHAGIPDCVSNGENGFLVTEGDVKSMADNIATLAKNFELRQKLGKKSWLRAKQEFSWEIEKEKLLTLMQIKR